MTRDTTQREDSSKAVRVAAVVLAVCCLYLQLLAASLCPHMASSSSASAHGPFPICHARSDTGDQGPTDQGGSTDHCPFCALHCHFAVALAPTTHHPLLVDHETSTPDRPSFAFAVRPRRFAGVSPRGPPLPRTI